MCLLVVSTLVTIATAQPQVKKRRGRRPKLHLLSSASTRHLMSTESAQASQDGNHGNLGNAVCAVAGSPEPLKDGNATPSMSHVTTSVSGVSVIVPAALPSAAGEGWGVGWCEGGECEGWEISCVLGISPVQMSWQVGRNQSSMDMGRQER